MPTTIAVPCLCGSTQFRVLFDKPYKENDAGDFLATTDCYDNYGRIVRCRACGLVYTNPRPDENFISAGYAESEDPQYIEEPSSRSINAHISLATIRRFAKSGRLLEIGCATGYFLNAARTDYEVEGVEPSRWAAAEASRRFGIKVQAAALKDAQLPDASFDVVVHIDVIEHLPDPAALIAQCRRALKPGGVMYLVTPDVDSFSARVLRGRWWGLRPAHIYYFSRKTLEDLLDKNGFEIVLARSFGRIFTFAYWASRLKNYPAVLRRPLEWAIGLFGLEDKILYLNTRDSIEVVARKRA